MEKEILLGAHTSGAKCVFNALYEGKNIGANTIQLFTSNQRQWTSKKLSKEEIIKWEKAKEDTGIDIVMSHDSYLINLGSCKEDILEKSKNAFIEEIKRCCELKITFLNFHPGSATGETEEKCLDTIVDSLLSFEGLIAKGDTTIVLETTAGQGTNVGYTFEQLSYIIERTKKNIPIKVCIDTCHIFAAGYDIRTKKNWENVFCEFDEKIGLDYLCAFHLNDSKFDLGSRKDRHAHIGDGKIGWESFKVLMNHPKTKYLPKYLETPKGKEFWKDEIAKLKQLTH